jgi:hypothetical protein
MQYKIPGMFEKAMHAELSFTGAFHALPADIRPQFDTTPAGLDTVLNHKMDIFGHIIGGVEPVDVPAGESIFALCH